MSLLEMQPVRRIALISLLLTLAVAAPAPAQEWARKMFTDTSHDFGTVAHGSKTQYHFKFTNPYLEPVHISSVRSSCSCTSPEASKAEVKTFESGEVVANFNTSAFSNNHSATLTVTFDKPYAAEVQLQVSGNIRSDVVMQPGVVELGSVNVGQAAEKKISVTRFGRNDWTISDVRSANTNFEVEVKEHSRGGGNVVYDLLVRLKPGAPAGYVNDQLYLVTNDSETPQIPVDVEGRVVADVTVSPTSLSFGALAPGETVTKNILVRNNSHRSFKVLQIICDDCFSCNVPAESGEAQRIPITFTAGKDPGKIVKKIRIKTDLGENAVPDITCQATILDSPDAPIAASASTR